MNTPDYFRSRADTMIDWTHPLAVLARRMPGQSIEAPLFERMTRPGGVISREDLLGQPMQLAATIGAPGRLRLPICLMVFAGSTANGSFDPRQLAGFNRCAETPL